MAGTIYESVIGQAVREGLLGDEQPLAAFVDVSRARASVDALKAAFPAHFEHMFAAKANTMIRALCLVRDAGMGCEVFTPCGTGA